ncbi:hypothetical protein E5161_13130 [Cohnella pontilimi]|uniref:Uncharacterized protein n=1 Tax=Cohnella pontilimi TaxID=2564100 RepID=A0A4U0F9I5_9BACL|nr:hypothetical protein [Cohnella pontilimi]TJY41357.1 hypothetical protein E5161_13130 [Cohnella pontilimi]
MIDSIQGVKVSVVSGVLIAGFMSWSDVRTEAGTKVCQALVGRYSIERRQWVEIGRWFCQLAETDNVPVVKKQSYHPAAEIGFYLDARHMNVHWQGDYERFARQCEAWILQALEERGVRIRKAGTDSPTEQERETVNEAFHRWCQTAFHTGSQKQDTCR